MRFPRLEATSSDSESESKSGAAQNGTVNDPAPGMDLSLEEVLKGYHQMGIKINGVKAERI